MRFSIDIFATTEDSDFKIGRLMGFAKAHHKIPPKKRGRERWPGLGELPKIWGFPFNIYAMAESIDFKFRLQLGLPRPIVKSHRKEKMWVGPGLEELPKILGFPLIFLAMAKASDFKFGTTWVSQSPSQNHTKFKLAGGCVLRRPIVNSH